MSDIHGGEDHDGDGLTTYLEWVHETDPNDPASTVPDLDRDRLSNLDELQNGANGSPVDDAIGWVTRPLHFGYVDGNNRNQVVSYAFENGEYRLKLYTGDRWENRGRSAGRFSSPGCHTFGQRSDRGNMGARCRGQWKRVPS